MKVLNIADNLLASLENETLSEDETINYFRKNQKLLKSNIKQAYSKYRVEDLTKVVERVFPEIISKKDLILSNKQWLTETIDQLSDKLISIYSFVPEVTIVPCIGLFAASGWASKERGHHVFIALEFPHSNMDIILAHEVAHAMSQDTWEIVLDGFYREGHAVYVSSMLFPGHGEEEYLFMSQELHHRCLEWKEANGEKILNDSTERLKVLNRLHKFYFTTGHNPDYPNIGYVVGYHFVKYLNRKHSLPDLLDFSLKRKRMLAEFTEFIKKADSSIG